MTAPRAAYRLQLGPNRTLAAAAAALPYLRELGASHIYLSPILESGGQSGGYDVVDPDRVAEALGGDAALEALATAARAAGIGLLLDIVPNHMSVAGQGNRWWLDVLENGPASMYAPYFDVDWSGDDRILLPVLVERYGRALTAGHLGLVHDGAGRVAVRAGEVRLPIAPRSLGTVVARAGERARSDELFVLGEALGGLDTEDRRRRSLRRAVMLRRLADLCTTSPECAAALDAEIESINSDPAEIDAVLEAQSYRLAHWSVAASDLGYRRFFDVHTLVGLRIEDPAVFTANHHRILGWLADGTIDGVRIDHIDGLREPLVYLERLRQHAPDAWIVVEKILAAGEYLPVAWPVDGTTGYDAMELLGGLFVDPAGEAPLTRAFEALTGETWVPAAAARAARLEVLSDALHSELVRLAELAHRASAASPAHRDYTTRELEAALAEILAGYTTYRTYLPDGAPGDRAHIAAAVAAAVTARPEIDRGVFAFLEAALAFELPNPDAIELAYRAQQQSGAVMAKGVEDTVLYRQIRLLARCEVGADLGAFAIAPAEVHRGLAALPPRTLVATSTHDTKRSEDVRARIAALSHVAEPWIAAATRWMQALEAHWGGAPPDRLAQYFLLQTLVGAWPISVERVRAVMLKSVREMRTRTSWHRPDHAYEAALSRVIDAAFAPDLAESIAAFVDELRPHGDRSALAQLLVKLTCPGVPDIYQGTELRDDSLVDPDNRRPVDLDARARGLAELATGTAEQVRGDLGLAKLWTIHRVLRLRRDRAVLFAATYRALDTGDDRVFAFARGEDLITVVPRLGGSAQTVGGARLALPPGRWHGVLDDQALEGTVAVATLWRTLPIALLVRE